MALWVGIAWAVCCLISPLVFGLMGLPSPFGPLVSGLVLMWLGGVYRLLRQRADPVYDGWPWNSDAEPPPTDDEPR